MSTALQSEDLAFESLYRLHRPPVYAFALSTLRNPADAEDVTQTTFLNAYCALHRGVTPRDDLQWLLAIARNACRDRFRDAKRRPKEEPLADWIRLVQPDEPDYSVQEICKEISELNPRYRQILLLREFEGRSYAEISEQLGVTEAAVQTLLGRARRALRDELELGMTCAHARRVALRHLNGVALRDERRGLQRHLRRCADCSTFVGRAPRTPVARMLWLVWLPYRRFMGVVAATTTPAGSTAGGVGALAAKVLAVTVVGSAAVGVTAREVSDVPSFGHGKQTPARPATASRGQRPADFTQPSSSALAWSTNHVTVGRTGLSHTRRHPTPRLAPQGSATPAATTDVQKPSFADPVPGASIPPVPATPESTEQPATVSASVAPSQDSGTGVATTEVPTPAPASTTGAADTSSGAGGSAVASTPPSATGSPSPGSDAAPAPSTTPVTTPPATAPPPVQGPGRGNGNGNGNGVGQGGTPPGQAAKADSPASGGP